MAERPRRLSHRLRLMVVSLTMLLALVLANLEIIGKERILRDGTTVLLRLAPVDPRSLLQGDYMALRYAMADEVAAAAQRLGVDDGIAVIALDDANRATFVAIHRSQPLGPGEQLLRFRKRGDSVRLASDAFFFEEGSGDEYTRARFGELAAGADGEAVLMGLRDAEGHRLGTTIKSVR